MKPLLFCIFLLGACTALYAQTGTITGRVMDADSRQPLPFTNVYVNNTTLGVLTDAEGRFSLPDIPTGASELVVSFVGYVPQQLKITIKKTDNLPLLIQLRPDAQQVVEVRVKASRDKTWEKQLKRFEAVFLGNTSACKILNPWVIDFASEPGMVTAKAAIPVEIDNKKLGYKLFFQLKKVEYSPTQFSIVGTTRFIGMQTADKTVALDWARNRERAYRGSARHLMKSIRDGQVSQQGFVLYRDKVHGKLRSKNFSAELATNLLPYDTVGMVTPGPDAQVSRIGIKTSIEVHYTNEFTTTPFYQDVSNPVSWLEPRNGYIFVNQDGELLNPTEVTISGSMADGRISSMLPFDYKPGSLVAVQSPRSLSVRRLQENVYLHTDKPYYYPGETIWLSAYMAYQTPGLRDSLSRVLYVDLIDAARRTTHSLVLPIDSGRAANAIRLPTTMAPGSYVLRAYTQWMRNYGTDHFFYKPVPIVSLGERVAEVAPNPVADNVVSLSFDKPAYARRSRVTMTLSLDTTGLSEPITGSFSVSVFDALQTVPVASPVSIKKDYSAAWSVSEVPATFDYAVEKGIGFEGLYTDKKGKAKKTKFTLLPERLDHIYPIATSATGQFSLTGLAIYDSAKFIIQPPEGTVVVLPKEAPALPETLPQVTWRLAPLATPRLVYSGDTLRGRLLREVNVVATKTVRPESSYGKPDVSIKGEAMEQYATVADAIAAKLPMFKLINEQMNWYLIWARASVPTSRDLAGGSLASHEPNLYINNQLVVGETAGDRLMQLNPSLIDHIEVSGKITANQGANGSNGLIDVFYKRPAEVSSKGLSLVSVRGFDREPVFRSPTYERPATNADAGDYRATLYWNPHITLGPTPVQLSFFTSDQPGPYRVVIEGVTSKGTAVHTEAVLTVTTTDH